MQKNQVQLSNKRKVEDIFCIIALFAVIIFVGFIIFDQGVNFQWLNDNSGAIVAIFTVVLVFITIYYAWQTRNSVKIMQDAENARVRPYIHVYLEQMEICHSFLYLIIENRGNTPAFDVVFKISEDFDINLGASKKVSQIRQIKNGIRMLASYKKLEIPFFSLIDKVDFFEEKDLQICINYVDSRGYKYSDCFNINIDEVVESKIGSKPIISIDKNIEKIAKNMDRVQKDIKRIINNYDKK